MQTKADIVSFDSENLILVDADDQETGALDKASCHDGDGVLHRAFSLFIFNASGQLLLQQRAAEKRLWPGFWSNSCCSHPRAGEQLEVATHRRLEQELGMTASLDFVYKFQYQARFDEHGSENELCSVFLGTSSSDPIRNTREIEAFRWIGRDELNIWLDQSPQAFTPWFKMEWETLQRDYGDTLGPYLRS